MQVQNALEAVRMQQRIAVPASKGHTHFLQLDLVFRVPQHRPCRSMVGGLDDGIRQTATRSPVGDRVQPGVRLQQPASLYDSSRQERGRLNLQLISGDVIFCGAVPCLQSLCEDTLVALKTVRLRTTSTSGSKRSSVYVEACT